MNNFPHKNVNKHIPDKSYANKIQNPPGCSLAEQSMKWYNYIVNINQSKMQLNKIFK